MATGNDMMEAVNLVDGIVGELRGFDETPPPKKVWLDIADRLEKAFGQYRNATMSFMDGIKAKIEDMDSPLDHQTAFKMLGTMEWKETMFLDLQTHDFGGGIFMLRCKHGEPNEHYCIIKANDVDEAIILAQRVIIMSARPGRIKEIVDINIPYPRTQETKMTEEFIRLKNHIWSQVYQEYLEVRK